jgi:exopolyphosphatase/guanosine-5'-triphosphate,3'-diphosphate pyrophosphatase
MTRVAAIDCGTNSIRLLVADIDGGTLTDVDRRMEVVRLGQDVDRTGRLAPEALERTFTACRAYADAIEKHGATRLRFVATSATRDAANRGEFTAGVKDILGVEPDVASGDEEAGLSFTGATRGIDRGRFPAPYLVLDIGGGSTEFVIGEDRPTASRSVDVGCVRMTERHLVSDPPTAEEIAAARADIEAAVTDAGRTVPLRDAATLVGVAGSVTTVVAMALDLPAYDPLAIHNARISAEDVHDVTKRLLAATRAERAALPFMHPGRVDVIGAGALVLDTAVAMLGVDGVVASEHDILDGIAWSLA